MYAQTKVKVCGFTKPDNAGEVALLGVNAIGIVFAEQSARFVSVDVASTIARSIPPFVSVVALFVDPSQRQVSEVISRVRPDLLQFHGAESSEFCNQFSVSYIKALRVTPELDLVQCCDEFGSARGILLDAFSPKGHGGTGESFDWRLIPKGGLSLPIVLAGGLSIENVGDAVGSVSPWGVDVSSGVEGPVKGEKNIRLVKDFIREVRDADERRAGEL